MLGKIFGPKEERIIGDCRKLHNMDLHDLYCSQNITSDQIKDDEMGVTYVGREMHIGVWWGNLKETGPPGRRGLRWKDVYNWSKRNMMRCGLDSSGP
jgi:hypothetical protein